MHVWIPLPILTDSLPPVHLHAASLAHSSGPPASPVTHCKCMLSALERPAACERCVEHRAWCGNGRARSHTHTHKLETALQMSLLIARKTFHYFSHSAKQGQSFKALASAIALPAPSQQPTLRPHVQSPSRQAPSITTNTRLCLRLASFHCGRESSPHWSRR